MTRSGDILSLSDITAHLGFLLDLQLMLFVYPNKYDKILLMLSLPGPISYISVCSKIGYQTSIHIYHPKYEYKKAYIELSVLELANMPLKYTVQVLLIVVILPFRFLSAIFEIGLGMRMPPVLVPWTGS